MELNDNRVLLHPGEVVATTLVANDQDVNASIVQLRQQQSARGISRSLSAYVLHNHVMSEQICWQLTNHELPVESRVIKHVCQQ
jgi:hypothetical protein